MRQCVRAEFLEDLPELQTAARPEMPWSGLSVVEAPEPRDIYWENLVNDGSYKQTAYRVLTQVCCSGAPMIRL